MHPQKRIHLHREATAVRVGREGRWKNLTVSLSSPCKIQIRQWVHCVWGSFKQHSEETGPHPSPGVTNCSWSLSYFPSSKPLCQSKRNVFKKQKRENIHELCIKTKNWSYRCVFEPPNLNIFEKSNLTQPLGLRILLLFEDYKIDLDVVDDTTVTDTPPWSQSEPQICLSLTKYKTDFTIPEVYKQAFLEITSRHPKYMQLYTDGSKVDEKVAAAAVSSVAANSPFSCRQRDHCSIYTAELQVILFPLKQVYQSKEKKFMIFSDSLSALQALKNLKTDHPLLIQIQELLHKINADKKETIFMWVPRHIGIRGNEAADTAAKEALNIEPTAGLVPFSDLKPLTSKYVCEVWQREWDEAGLISNKFHEILPRISGKLLSFCNTRKENTVLNRLHIGHSYLTNHETC